MNPLNYLTDLPELTTEQLQHIAGGNIRIDLDKLNIHWDLGLPVDIHIHVK